MLPKPLTCCSASVVTGQGEHLLLQQAISIATYDTHYIVFSIVGCLVAERMQACITANIAACNTADSAPISCIGSSIWCNQSHIV